MASSLGATIDFETVNAVHESWDRVKKIPDYEKIAGELLFRKIFELAPGAINMYTFGPQFVGNEDALFQSAIFQQHASGVVGLLNEAVEMLGPDLVPVLEELTKLGARHVSYGVLPAHYGIVGQALLATLEAALGDNWTPLVQKGWTQTYGFVSTAMMTGADHHIQRMKLKNKKRERRAAAKKSGQVVSKSNDSFSSLTSPRKNRDSPKKSSTRRLIKRNPVDSAANLARISNVVDNLGESSRPTQEDISRVLQDVLDIHDGDETVSSAGTASTTGGSTDREDEVIYCELVDVVDRTWAKVKKIPNYKEVAGTLLFQKIFEIAPAARALFDFTKGFSEDDEALYSDPRFLAHATRVVSMLDVAVNMLGPDLEPVSYALEELGKRHVDYGVIPAHYPIVGQALLSTLEAALGNDWTPTAKEGWTGIYGFVSTTMIKGANTCSQANPPQETEDSETASITEQPAVVDVQAESYWIMSSECS